MKKKTRNRLLAAGGILAALFVLPRLAGGSKEDGGGQTLIEVAPPEVYPGETIPVYIQQDPLYNFEDLLAQLDAAYNTDYTRDQFLAASYSIPMAQQSISITRSMLGLLAATSATDSGSAGAGNYSRFGIAASWAGKIAGNITSQSPYQLDLNKYNQFMGDPWANPIGSILFMAQKSLEGLYKRPNYAESSNAIIPGSPQIRSQISINDNKSTTQYYKNSKIRSKISATNNKFGGGGGGGGGISATPGKEAIAIAILSGAYKNK